MGESRMLKGKITGSSIVDEKLKKLKPVKSGESTEKDDRFAEIKPPVVVDIMEIGHHREKQSMTPQATPQATLKKDLTDEKRAIYSVQGKINRKKQQTKVKMKFSVPPYIAKIIRHNSEKLNVPISEIISSIIITHYERILMGVQ